jgi:predicted aspartyl protease
MSFPFESKQGLIIVPAELWGPSGSAVLRLAVDTGATGTLVNVATLVAIGYDPALASDRTQVTTGSGVEFVPRVVVERIVTVGQERKGFEVQCIPCRPAQELMVYWVWISFAVKV